MELKKLTDNVYYLADRTNIGVVKGKNGAILIDAGIDRDAAKKASKILEQNRMGVVAVVNTHSHADHCGGDAFFREKGARIYAPELEAAIIGQPDLEPLYLFSGAKPPAELVNRFLRGEPCPVDEAIEGDQHTVLAGDLKLDVVPLKGHSPNQMGFHYDGVLFCADSMFSLETLAKHKVPFHTDIGEARKTMERLKASNYAWYVPSHAEATQDISSLVDANLKNLDDIEDWFRGRKFDGTGEEHVNRLCTEYGISIGNVQQYALMHTVTMAWLSYLKDIDVKKPIVNDNKLIWLSI